MPLLPKKYSVHFLGSGDAFGCGGHFQPCIYVQAKYVRFLLDCGASALIAMKRFGVDPGQIDFILLTHMGDDMLTRLPGIEFEWAEDGKRIDL
jgi:ribonuclease BN (tRNA processing enzyme)